MTRRAAIGGLAGAAAVAGVATSAWYLRSTTPKPVVRLNMEVSPAQQRPRVLFDVSQYVPATGPYSYPFPNYDVSPDGQRFLMITRESKPQINVVLNWFEELKRRVPSVRRS